MSYSITYPWDREQKLVRKPSSFPKLMPGLFIVGGAFALRLLVPEIGDLVKQLLHPLMDETTWAAVAALTEDLTEGVPMGEAVAVFCQEVLRHG